MAKLVKSIATALQSGQPSFSDDDASLSSDSPPQLPGATPPAGAVAPGNSGDPPPRTFEDPAPSPYVVTPDGRIALRDPDPPAGDDRPALASGLGDAPVGQLGGTSDNPAAPSLRDVIENPALIGLSQARETAVDLPVALSAMDARSSNGISFAASAAQLVDAMASFVDRNAGFAAPQFLQTSADQTTHPVITATSQS
jgi:hypothetical protein